MKRRFKQSGNHKELNDLRTKVKETETMVQEAEELRIKTIHELCIAAMEYGNPDYEQLLSWAKALLQDADNAYCKKNNNATKSYLFFYHNLWEYAKHHLSIQEYHQFCGKQIDYWKQLHHD